MISFRSLVNALLYSNVFIALGAASMVMLTYLEMDLPLQLTYYIGFTFFGTLFIYILHRVVSIFFIKEVIFDSRNKWLQTHFRGMLILMCLSALACVILIFYLHIKALIFLGIFSTAALLYGLPFYVGKHNYFRLRDVGLLKIFLIALVWGGITGLIPGVAEGVKLTNPELWGIAAERTLFIFAITIPFDIRDMDIDEQFSVSNIPRAIGIRNAKIMATNAIALYIIAVVFVYGNSIIPVVVIFSGITAILIWKADKKRGDWYYLGLIDGLIIMQFLLFYTLYYSVA